MLQGATNHTRHGSNRFQHDCSMAIAPGEKCVGEEAQKPDETIGDPIAKIPRIIIFF